MCSLVLWEENKHRQGNPCQQHQPVKQLVYPTNYVLSAEAASEGLSYEDEVKVGGVSWYNKELIYTAPHIARGHLQGNNEIIKKFNQLSLHFLTHPPWWGAF